MTTTKECFAALTALFPGRRPRFAAADFRAASAPAADDLTALIGRHLGQVMRSEEVFDLHRQQLAVRFGVTPSRPAEPAPDHLVAAAAVDGFDGLGLSDLLHLAFDVGALRRLQVSHPCRPRPGSRSLRRADASDPPAAGGSPKAGSRATDDTRPFVRKRLEAALSRPGPPVGDAELVARVRAEAFPAGRPAADEERLFLLTAADVLREFRGRAAAGGRPGASTLVAAAPAGAPGVASTLFDGRSLAQASRRLDELDPHTGELYRVWAFAGQTPETLAEVFGLPLDRVRDELQAAGEQVGDWLTDAGPSRE